MRQEHDFAWADREYAEIMKKKHNGVLLVLLDNGWAMADDEFEKSKVVGWGVSSQDGEQMLDEDETWAWVV